MSFLGDVYTSVPSSCLISADLSLNVTIITLSLLIIDLPYFFVFILYCKYCHSFFYLKKYIIKK